MLSVELPKRSTAEAAGELLRVEGIDKRFPGVQALQDVTLSVRQGEVHALVGQNGAGKSTLAKCIAGVYAPDNGRILLEGSEVQLSSPRRAFELGIATVHQRPELLPSLSVAENIALGDLPVHNGRVFIDRRRAYGETGSLLDRLSVPIDVRTLVRELSVADRQQVAIAKALHRKARLLILDEPTVCLDGDHIERLFALISELQRQEMSILYISHHLEEIFRIADRVTVLRDGRLVATRPARELSEEETVTLMAGGRVPVFSGTRDDRRTGDRAAVEFRGVRTDVLHDVDLVVNEGEVVGITGLIGAGGHGIALVLFGLERPRAGKVALAGKPYRPRGPKDAIKSGVFMVPEDAARAGLVPLLSVAANVTLVDLRTVRRHGLLSLRRERDIARKYVSELRIATPTVASPVRGLSGGNQQKVLMAKSLAAGARVLVLEEPTQGIDVRAKSEIHRLTRELAARGKSVIVISTDIKDLLEYVDRLIAFRNHRVVADLRANETSYAAVLDLTIGAEERGE